MLPTNNNNNNASALQQAVKVYQSIPFWFDMYVLAFERRHFLPHTTIINKKNHPFNTLLTFTNNTLRSTSSTGKHICILLLSRTLLQWTPQQTFIKMNARTAFLHHITQLLRIISAVGVAYFTQTHATTRLCCKRNGFSANQRSQNAYFMRE